jgi:O-antigen ligase
MYHGELRKNWFFSNPNVFGNLMGAGFLLACGLFIAQLKCFRKNYDSLHLWLSIALGAIAILTFINLVKSYSRGALVGTCVGTYYLLTIGMGGSQILSRSPVKSSIVLAFVVLCFWGCCNLEQPFAQRIFSIVNINDFSWTKRLATYEGALQIAGDHPWFGGGWNDLGQNYAQYYQPSNLLDGGAFFTNDFLFLAAAFGIPVTLCFVCFVCAQFGHGAGVLGVSLSGEERSSELVRMPCRAAAGVLLVASWFDGGPNGGLFTIATGATFWILLGLGSSNSAKN